MKTVFTFTGRFFYYPILEALSKERLGIDDLILRVGDSLKQKYNLSDEDLEATYEKTKDPKLKNTTYFGLIHLKENYAEFVKKEGRAKEAIYSITPLGKKFFDIWDKQKFKIPYRELSEFVLKEAPEKWKKSLLNKDNLIEKTEGSKNKVLTSSVDETVSNILDTSDISIEQHFNETYEAHLNELAEKVLDKFIESFSPVDFERQVGELLKRMGYGDVKYTPITGDQGIDIFLSQDPLGVSKIPVQVKQYKRDIAISGPDLRNFGGSLQMINSKTGIFVTTSYFTKDAKEVAKRLGIILIDGLSFARKCIKFQLGTQIKSTFEYYRLDTDYFESEDEMD